MEANLTAFRNAVKGLLSPNKEVDFFEEYPQQLMFVYESGKAAIAFYSKNSNSFFAFGFEVQGDLPETSINIDIDKDDFLKQLNGLPPNLKKVDFIFEGNPQSGQLLIKGKPSEVEIDIDISEDEANNFSLPDFREVCQQTFKNKDVEGLPDHLKHIFYAGNKNRGHYFFSSDGCSYQGFRFPDKTIPKSKGALICPFHIAMMAIATRAGRQPFNIAQKENYLHITQKAGKTFKLLGAVYTDLPSKVSQYTKPSNHCEIKINATNFWQLAYEQNKKLTVNKKAKTLYLWQLNLSTGFITDPLTECKVPTLNKVELLKESRQISIPIERLDYLMNSKNNELGEIVIKHPNDASSPLFVEFVQDEGKRILEFAIPQIAEPKAELLQQKNTIANLKRQWAKSKVAKAIKVTIQNGTNITQFQFLPSVEGILIAIDYEGVVVAQMPREESENIEELSLAERIKLLEQQEQEMNKRTNELVSKAKKKVS